jgi:small nuclear ribonucleoprotein (snRNP)-like protein
VVVELKTGRTYRGILESSDDAFNVALRDAAVVVVPFHRDPEAGIRRHDHHYRRRAAPSQRRRAGPNAASASSLPKSSADPPPPPQPPTPRLLPVLQVRGSAVRYVHLDGIDVNGLVSAGLERERAARDKQQQHQQRRTLKPKPGQVR